MTVRQSTSMAFQRVCETVTIFCLYPLQETIVYFYELELVPIGSKVISMQSLADPYEQRERNVLFVSADLCGGG